LPAKTVTLAAIAGAHGVAGDVRLKLFAESVESLSLHKSFNDGALSLLSVRAGGNGAIARFAEITNRNAAEAVRGTLLTVPRDALPPLGEGEYYHSDLIGLHCVSESGTALGTCVAIENFGAGDVIEIERPDGKRFMVPMTSQAVPRWDDTITVADPFAETDQL
jgi:16S rRNA processing protein RimM